MQARRPAGVTPFAWVLLLVLGSLLATGCSPRARSLDYDAGLARAMANRDYTNIASRKNTLAAMDVVTVASIAQRPRPILDAVGLIEENAGASRGNLAGAVSLATWEGARRYIGETYERAYASIIGGWAYWSLGQHENAAAMWRNAAAIDGESSQGYREDFGAANFLLAMWYSRRPGEEENMRIYLSRLLATHPQASDFANEDALRDMNLIVLVEIGVGPVKETTGPQGSILVYGDDIRPFVGADVFIDGQNRGRSSSILAVRVNAEKSLRPTEKVVWQAIRGTAVAAAIAYGVYRVTGDPVLAVLSAIVIKALPADTRQWWGVPADLQAFCATLEPGTYDIRVRPYGAWGSGLLSYEVEFKAVPVGGEFPTILLARPIPGLTSRALPWAEGRSIVQPNRKAEASPNAPIVSRGQVDSREWKKSPVYRYLPKAAD